MPTDRLRAPSIACLLVMYGCAGMPAQPLAGDDPPPPATVTSPPESLPSLLRLPTDVRPLGYAVDLTVMPGEPRFGGSVAIRVAVDRPRRHIWLNAEGLNVTAVSLDERPAIWSDARSEPAVAGMVEGVASVSRADGELIAAGETVLRVTFDAPVSHGGDSVFEVSEHGRSYVLTTFEPISARSALPCFDEPGFKTPFELTLTVPIDMVALANTPEVQSTIIDTSRKRVRFARSGPLPTYLFSFAVGPFDVVDAGRVPPGPGRAKPLPIRGVALHGKGERLRDQLAQAAPFVLALESWFALPYPYAKLDLVAIPSFPGAMENAALILFDERLLMVDRLRAPADEQRSAANTLAHELSHQWFGNLVTMAWWDDLWLNEAFASWIAIRMMAVVRPELEPETRRLHEWRSALEADGLASARAIRNPIASQHDIYSAFDGITYAKGASIIAMFEHWIGPDAWRDGVRAYLAAHADGNATTDDLLTAVERAAGRDVAKPFRSFLDASGAPQVTMTVQAVAPPAGPTAGELLLAVNVERWRPTGSTAPALGSWQVPVCLAASGLTPTCVLVTEAHQELRLPLTGEAPTALVPNVGGVGYYRAVVRPESLLREALREPRSPAEAATLVAGYEAAFDAGSLSAEAVLDALTPLLSRHEPELVRAPLALLDQIADRFVGEALRPAFERRARELVAPVAARVGWRPRTADERTGLRLLRGDVIAFMALTARDPAVRRLAAQQGRAIIARAGATSDAISPELRTTALTVAVEDGTPAFFAAVMRALHASADPSLRRDLMLALSATRDPALAERARALALDPRLSETEMSTVLDGQLERPHQQEAAFTWLQANFDALLARTPPFAVGYLPYLAQSLCDSDAHDRVERFFAPRVHALPGAPQALAETLEQIDLCRASVALQGDGVRRWISRATR